MMNERTNRFAVAGFPTRREAIAGVAVALGSIAAGATVARAAADEEISHSAESIHMEPVFAASRKRVYEALTDAKQFNKVVQLSAAVSSGMTPGKTPAEISREVGGTFSMFDGFIVGRHLELVPDERIVQAWRVSYWKPGEFSIARFVLVEEGAGTKIVFDHGGFPKGDAEHLAAGWYGNYWEPLKKFLASSAS
jgi:activator of HSP90 ATPase